MGTTSNCPKHLAQRRDVNRTLTEDFTYDSLNRLTASTLTAGGVAVPRPTVQNTWRTLGEGEFDDFIARLKGGRLLKSIENQFVCANFRQVGAKICASGDV